MSAETIIFTAFTQQPNNNMNRDSVGSKKLNIYNFQLINRKDIKKNWTVHP